ncbi:iron ABC transporter permease [Sphingomonas sp.]|uniref:FecCD family ABC transporter permease n=1 Tax=Sphingomonas sp. TaxID=28214 RepID=UPI001ED28602|nr:iron ABC transporter permease [Sphingomonas sp.]MBX3593322.1 iron ABC transporter permease [Sphingomonas sp.]
MSSRWLIPVLALLTLALALLSLGIGTLDLDMIGWLGGGDDRTARLTGLVLTEIRLPRTLLGLLTGAILGLAGAVLQGLLRNPLAEPGLLGISGGASLGAVVAIYYGFAAVTPLAAPLAGLAGAMATGLATLLLARGGGTLALILAGAAISSLAGAGISLALNLAPNPYAAYEIMTWLMGSLANRGWDEMRLAAPLILLGGGALLTTARALDGLALGEVQAESLGIDVARTRLVALAGTGLGVGAATAVVGTIGFVGLIAPHLVRPFVGHRPGATLVPAALAGAALLTAADIATRLIRLDTPIHLGVFTALVGAPFFLWLVLHVRVRGG